MSHCSYFCGCQTLLIENHQYQNPPTKLYISLLALIVTTILSIRLGIEWFIHKDYFPLKERSPLLCLILIFLINLKLVLYPALYTVQFLTNSFPDTQGFYRIAEHALEGAIPFIYFLRSLRLWYAHRIDCTRTKNVYFLIFKQEFLLACFLGAFILLRILPLLIASDDYKFYTMIQFNSPVSALQEPDFLLKKFITFTLMLGILLLALYLQFNVHRQYSMHNQITLVTLLYFLHYFAILGIIIGNVKETSIFIGICNDHPQYPVIQFIHFVKIFMVSMITIVYPLTKKKLEHKLLPIGRTFDLVKTMRDFLMEPQFLEIFQSFLSHLDKDEKTQKYSNTLKFWKQLLVLKYNNNSDDSEFDNLKDFVNEIEQFWKETNELSSVKKSRALNGLKKSVMELEDRVNESQASNQKLRETIYQRVDELQLLFLERLDSIYKGEFMMSQAYINMKNMLYQNRRININMILLRMALMVDSQVLN